MRKVIFLFIVVIPILLYTGCSDGSDIPPKNEIAEEEVIEEEIPEEEFDTIESYVRIISKWSFIGEGNVNTDEIFITTAEKNGLRGYSLIFCEDNVFITTTNNSGNIGRYYMNEEEKKISFNFSGYTTDEGVIIMNTDLGDSDYGYEYIDAFLKFESYNITEDSLFLFYDDNYYLYKPVTP